MNGDAGSRRRATVAGLVVAAALLAVPGAADAQVRIAGSAGTVALQPVKALDESTPEGCLLARMREGRTQQEAVAACGTDASADVEDAETSGHPLLPSGDGDRRKAMEDCMDAAQPQRTEDPSGGDTVSAEDGGIPWFVPKDPPPSTEGAKDVGTTVLTGVKWLFFGGTKETNIEKAETKAPPAPKPDDGSYDVAPPGTGGDEPAGALPPTCLDEVDEERDPVDCDAPAPDELSLGDLHALCEETFTEEEMAAAVDRWVTACMSNKQPGEDGTTVCSGEPAPEKQLPFETCTDPRAFTTPDQPCFGVGGGAPSPPTIQRLLDVLGLQAVVVEG